MSRARSTFARIAAIALLAHIGSGAVCLATCAATAQPAATVVSNHGVRVHPRHCREAPQSGSRVGAEQPDAPCAHQVDQVSQIAESRNPVGVDAASIALLAPCSTSPALTVARHVSRYTGPPVVPRAPRFTALRI